ncbi:efflux RND transporter periplasmic adaptor subunit [Pigmentiphaga sp.]|uniref:efflux RND transporter periplasmic adaptor subunit n=1 Tax=Pigmentiphaga sp. TaxID=1977564 RepID=UPI00128D7717|nr:efflux RND transporter periplasmic adaptor subunit [Pigmentiphaga sp.]MPS28666.1 efflux RND transporter periplasmic adaptor subunit [Alcaligenaceae bacterium SAGV5]MPS52411.1 efflux RND transporter periplasmic adaptor subunit [Alcaligenaceae bacterium SAGV3]MPT58118.1 efflux RND transporter periplasmic adaptor subunit [Alcaligenaceae bacterium]
MFRFRKHALAVTLGVAVLGVAGGIAVQRMPALASQEAPAAPAPAAAVDVAEVVSRSITDWRGYSGRLEAVDRVEIRPLVSGTLTAVHFQDGALVKKGEVLFTIDPRPYAAEVARVQGQLAAAEARDAYAASDLARGQRLLADNAIAKRDFEEKQNAAREAVANLQAARAALEAARLNLEYTRITAPVSGRISRAQVTVGNVVAAGAASAPLTTLVSTARMYAAFDVDEPTYLKMAQASRAGSGTIPVYLGLANEDGHPRKGTVSFIDNRLDVASGTIRVRAVFDNPDGQLIPGLYARVQLGGGKPRDALLIDERAVGTDQDKRFVLVLEEGNRTSYREVRLGTASDGLRVVDAGLKAGERIVVNGLQRVRPGEPVAPREVPMAGQPGRFADDHPPADGAPPRAQAGRQPKQV